MRGELVEQELALADGAHDDDDVEHVLSWQRDHHHVDAHELHLGLDEDDQRSTRRPTLS